MRDSSPGADGEPFEDLSKHVEGKEAGGGYCVDLGFHGEFAVEYDAEDTGVVGRGGWGSKFERPPAVIPMRGVVADDQHFRLVSVEFQAVVSHSVGDTRHASAELVLVLVGSSESERMSWVSSA